MPRKSTDTTYSEYKDNKKYFYLKIAIGIFLIFIIASLITLTIFSAGAAFAASTVIAGSLTAAYAATAATGFFTSLIAGIGIAASTSLAVFALTSAIYATLTTIATLGAIHYFKNFSSPLLPSNDFLSNSLLPLPNINKDSKVENLDSPYQPLYSRPSDQKDLINKLKNCLIFYSTAIHSPVQISFENFLKIQYLNINLFIKNEGNLIINNITQEIFFKYKLPDQPNNIIVDETHTLKCGKNSSQDTKNLFVCLIQLGVGNAKKEYDKAPEFFDGILAPAVNTTNSP